MRALLLIIIICPFLLFAQSKENPKVVRYFFHSHGISFQDFKNLNARVRSFPQYADLKRSTGTLEFGLITKRDKTLILYNFIVGSSLSGNKEKKSTATKFLGGSIDLGYNVLEKNNLSIYPFLGLGFVKYSVLLKKDYSSIPFDSLLQNSTVQQNVSPLNFNNNFLAYKTGIGINLKSVKHPRNSAGLQMGYSGSFNKSKWKVNNTQLLDNSPKDLLSKLFFQVNILYQMSK